LSRATEVFLTNDLQIFNGTLTLNDCIEQCAYFNRLNPSVACAGVDWVVYAKLCFVKSLIVGPGNDDSNAWNARLEQVSR